MTTTTHATRRPLAATITAVLAALFTTVFAPAARAQAEAISVIPAINPRTPYVGQPMQLEFKVSGTQDARVVGDIDLDWATARYITSIDTSRSMTMIVNGRQSVDRYEGVSLIYEITPSREGQFTIPPMTIEAGGQRFRTGDIAIHVKPPRSRDDIRLRASLSDTTPYIGQPVTLTIDMLIGVKVENPRFSVPLDPATTEVHTPSSPAAHSAGTHDSVDFLGAPAAVNLVGQETANNRTYSIYRVERVIIPRATGEIPIGPVALAVDIITREARGMSVFNRNETEPAFISSDPLTMNVSPLPAEGRPAGFDGPIGQFTLQATASPTSVNVGDPIDLQLRITGTAPLELIPPIDLNAQPGFARAFKLTGDAPPPIESNGSIVFRRTIRATTADLTELPALELPYFDPEAAAYRIARSRPVQLDVHPARIVTSADARGGQAAPASLDASAGGIAHIYEGDALRAGGELLTLAAALRSPALLATAAAGPAAFCATLAFAGARRRAKRTPTRAERARRAAHTARAALDAAAHTPDAPARITAALHGYIADRTGEPPASLTTRRCRDILAAHNTGAADAFAAILDRCDAARFAPAATADTASLLNDAREALRAAEEAWR